MGRIVHEMLTREYTKTLDEPVPALDHKAPRALAHTTAGRAKVADWLKYIENSSAKSALAIQWRAMILHGCGKSWG